MALLGISDGARRAMEGARAGRAHMYDTLLRDYRRAAGTPI